MEERRGKRSQSTLCVSIRLIPAEQQSGRLKIGSPEPTSRRGRTYFCLHLVRSFVRLCDLLLVPRLPTTGGQDRHELGPDRTPAGGVQLDL